MKDYQLDKDIELIDEAVIKLSSESFNAQALGTLLHAKAVLVNSALALETMETYEKMMENAKDIYLDKRSE